MSNSASIPAKARSPPAGLEGRLLPPLRSHSSQAGTSPTTTIPPPLKRLRFPSHISIPATSSSFHELPRKMSRFANTGPSPTSADAWSHHHHHIQDRVVLPPLSTAVDNASRRASLVQSPSSYNSQGYAFTNTSESQRTSTASSGMSSARATGWTSPFLLQHEDSRTDDIPHTTRTTYHIMYYDVYAIQS